ncbi:MAG: hypothetical protein LBQ09_05145 [Acidobacteriaceae bacterium]|jgi:uncharacterized membrane protein|nr:hypothetical protein [Acidobacteriaceae bacterium]
MAALHPQVVHFAIALGLLGVGCRVITLTGRLKFLNQTATVLVLLATISCFVAAATGDAAHGPVERIPGVRSAVSLHEEWGERARLAFALLAPIEIIALLLYSREHRRAYAVSVLAAVVGIGAALTVAQAGKYGGELVYDYAGGIGTRSGTPESVNRLFVAGLYQQALQERQANKSLEAMQLIDLAASRAPGNLDLQLLAAEWTIDIKQAPVEALARLERIEIPASDARSKVRAGLARARALDVQGNRDGARTVVQTLINEYPNRADLQRRLAELSGAASQP